MRRREVTRPSGWRYWGRRAWRNFVRVFLRGLYVMAGVSVLMVIMSAVGSFPDGMA